MNSENTLYRLTLAETVNVCPLLPKWRMSICLSKRFKMQNTFRLRFCAWLFVFLLCGCGTKNEVADQKDDLSFGELVAKAHFLAKELHFNMQSVSDQQFNTSVFKAFKEQLEEITGNASTSDLSKKQQTELIAACNSLKENFEHVISGSDDYHARFLKVDAKLMREILVLESMSER